MRRSHYDFLFVLAAVALAGWLYHVYSAAPAPATAPVAGAVDFTLSAVGGGPKHLADVKGPVFVFLSAVGCPDCQERTRQTDRDAMALAKQRGLTTWNLLVYADQPSGANFVSQFAPSADAVLVDEGGQIGVNLLGGSDATCYILLDQDHRKVWQGPADPKALEEAVAKMQGGSVTTTTTDSHPYPPGASAAPGPDAAEGGGLSY